MQTESPESFSWNISNNYLSLIVWENVSGESWMASEGTRSDVMLL